MKTFLLLLSLLVTLAQFEAVAHADAAVHAAAGMRIVSADGHNLGAIYKVMDDGSVRLIVDGKMVVIAKASLHEEHDTIMTSLTKSEIYKRR